MTQNIPSDRGDNTNNDQPSQGRLDIEWDEVEYEVYGNFQESDGYQSSEVMGTMMDSDHEREDPMTEDNGSSDYETTSGNLEEEESHVVKYMTTRDFGEAPNGSPVYQYHVHMVHGDMPSTCSHLDFVIL